MSTLDDLNKTVESMISKLNTNEKIDRKHWIYLLEQIQYTFNKRIEEIEYGISEIEKKEREIAKLEEKNKRLSQELLVHNRRRNNIKEYKNQYYYNRKHINHKLKYIDSLIDKKEELSALYELSELQLKYINRIGGKKYLQDQITKRRSKIKRYIRKEEKTKKSKWRQKWKRKK